MAEQNLSQDADAAKAYAENQKAFTDLQILVQKLTLSSSLDEQRDLAEERNLARLREEGRGV